MSDCVFRDYFSFQYFLPFCFFGQSSSSHMYFFNDSSWVARWMLKRTRFHISCPHSSQVKHPEAKRIGRRTAENRSFPVALTSSSDGDALVPIRPSFMRMRRYGFLYFSWWSYWRSKRGLVDSPAWLIKRSLCRSVWTRSILDSLPLQQLIQLFGVDPHITHSILWRRWNSWSRRWLELHFRWSILRRFVYKQRFVVPGFFEIWISFRVPLLGASWRLIIILPLFGRRLDVLFRNFGFDH